MSKETIIDKFSFIEISVTKNKSEYEIYEKGRPLGNLQINFSNEFMKFSPNSNTSSRYNLSEVSKSTSFKVEDSFIQISVVDLESTIFSSYKMKPSLESIERLLNDNRVKSRFSSYGAKEKEFDGNKLIEFSKKHNEVFLLYFYYFLWKIEAMNIQNLDLDAENLISQSLSMPLRKLLDEDESQGLEFKDSFQWSYDDNCKKKSLAKRVSKTIRAFLNSSGGVLIIGVHDTSKKIMGRDPDLKIDDDKFLLRINNQIKNDPGPTYLNPTYTQSEFLNIEDKTILAMKVYPSSHPVYSAEGELVWRANNESYTAANHLEANDYIERWFKK